MRSRLPSPALVVALVALVVALGGFAVAAVPDKQGRISACYVKRSGDLRILTKGTRCRRGEKALVWNQTGPVRLSGQQGPTGEQGTPGRDGTAGTDGKSGDRGPAAASMLTGNTGNATIAPDVPSYLSLSGTTAVFGSASSSDMLSPARAIGVRDLAVRLSRAPGIGQSYDVSLLNDGLLTGVSCTVTGISNGCSDSTHTAQIAPRAGISVFVESTPGAAARRVAFAWRAVDAP